jgi:hypothetical protein
MDMNHTLKLTWSVSPKPFTCTTLVDFLFFVKTFGFEF